MASSQVEFVSSSPFGCVLRDHNRNNGRSTFQKNLKDLVQSCISKSNPNENSQIQMNDVDFNGTGGQRKSRVHDRWAKAREIVFPQKNEDAQSVSSNASTFLSDTSVETPSLGAVSSLVQRWRDFEAEGKISFCTSRSNSVELPGTPPVNVNVNEDNFWDWESDRTVQSGRDSDDAENERLRVVDIIRKLKSAECNDCGESLGNETLPRVRVGLDHNLEQRGVVGVTCSPRIRGRQAFADLLMQMERERHRELEGLVERKTVSRFPQRGRIQALLRVRFLRRGHELKDGPRTNSTTCQLNRPEQGSTIMHLRERFSTGVEQGAACLRNSCREVVDNTPNMEKPCASNRPKEVVVDNTADVEYSSSSNQVREVIHHHDVTNSRRSYSDTAVDTTPNAATSSSSTANRLTECTHHEDAETTVHTPKVQNSEGLHQEPSMSDLIRQRIGSHESTDTVSSLADGCKENRNAKEQEGTNRLTHPQSVEEEQEANNRQLIETCCAWRCDISHPQSEWEEEEQSNEQQLEETSQDWISDIARPRSDWEGLRQERYQEMLDPYLDNGDIRQLLQRKSVSSFLSSGMRERIDQLMISRTQRQPQQMGNQVEEQNEWAVEEKEQEDEHDGDSNDDDDEEESPIGRGYSDFRDYADQTTSSNHEVTDDSDQVASPSPQQSPSSNFYFHDNQQRAFSQHPSVEMELIYDLRGHMEQLHQEMSEIRKSIKSCINMQSKLQRSMKQEVAAAISHSVKREGKGSISRVPRKGSCCVCCEMQVDSLLYRCGHMCTCFKCAHELQWSSGACPICRAPILDVVRTYADNR